MKLDKSIRVLIHWHVGVALVQFASLIALVGLYAWKGSEFLEFRVSVYHGHGVYAQLATAYPPFTLLMAFTGVTFISELLQAARLQMDSGFAADLVGGKRTNGLRWFEYSISASLMNIVIAQLSGVHELAWLLVLVLANISTQTLGYTHDAINTPRRVRVFWWCFAVAWLLFALQWMVILWYFIVTATTLCNGATLPGFVWAVIVVLLFFYAQFGILMGLHYLPADMCVPPRKWRRWLDFRSPFVYERSYMLLSLSAKLALTYIVAGGLLNLAGTGTTARTDPFLPCPVV